MSGLLFPSVHLHLISSSNRLILCLVLLFTSCVQCLTVHMRISILLPVEWVQKMHYVGVRLLIMALLITEQVWGTLRALTRQRVTHDV